MQPSLTQRFRNALRYAAASIGAIADEAGYSRIMFDTYVNRRPPSRDAVLALADALERRAARLEEHARRLREAAGEDGGVST